MKPACLLLIRSAILALMMCASSYASASVGFERTSFTEANGTRVEVGIWYPSDSTPTLERLELYKQNVALNAPVSGTKLPLVVISHGSGGSLAGHYDTALALAQLGFVVAALTHPGDNFRDTSREMNIVDRPAQVRELIDFVLTQWRGKDAVSDTRIGAFGFSAGGFTVLTLIGGEYDMSLIQEHCQADPKDWTCGVIAAHPSFDPAHEKVHATPADHDPRIRAAVIAAPALGFTFATPGLDHVRVPVQLWRAANDQILPHPFYAQSVRDAMPVAPEYHVVPDAGHYDFLAPCTPALSAAVPPICKSADGFDRAAFHHDFDDRIVAFFTQNLPENK